MFVAVNAINPQLVQPQLSYVLFRPFSTCAACCLSLCSPHPHAPLLLLPKAAAAAGLFKRSWLVFKVIGLCGFGERVFIRRKDSQVMLASNIPTERKDPQPETPGPLQGPLKREYRIQFSRSLQVLRNGFGNRGKYWKYFIPHSCNLWPLVRKLAPSRRPPVNIAVRGSGRRRSMIEEGIL